MGFFGDSVAALAGFVPEEVQALLLAGRDKELAPREREVTVAFCGLAGFTRLAEQLKPDLLLGLMSGALGGVEDAVRRNRGLVDKFMGDTVMALWNVPGDKPGHEADACMAALDCVDALRNLSEQLNSPKALSPRVGIASGNAVAGVMRFGSRRHYTVLGDEVNLASRLEGANKFFRTDILVAESVFRGAGDGVVLRPVGRVRVVGRGEPFAVYHVLGRKGRLPGAWDKALPSYLKAMEEFQGQRYREAAALFAEVLRLVPGDGPASVYSGAAQDYAMTPPSPSFDGVVNLGSK